MLATNSHIGDKEHTDWACVCACVCVREGVMGNVWMEILFKVAGHEQRVYKNIIIMFW